MKGTRQISWLSVLGIVLTLFLASILSLPDETNSAERKIVLSQTYNWKMTAWFPAGHPQNRQLVNFVDKINQRTDGKVKIALYEGTLGAPTDHWDMLRTNTIQLAYLAEGYNVGRMPVGTLFCLPFEFSGYEDMFKVGEEWLKAGYLREITDNFKVLYFKPTSFQHLFPRNKKIAKLEDFKGLKIRATAALHGQTVAALGATGVSIPGPEEYMALQTRVIDGTITGVDNVVGRKLYEVCRYGLQLPIFSGMWVLAMNKETWNNIPKELQMLIEEVSKEIYAAERKGIAEMENTSWETLRKLGLQVYTIPSEEKERWRKATDGVAERYVKEWNAKGYPVKEAFEMMRKIARK